MEMREWFEVRGTKCEIRSKELEWFEVQSWQF